MPDGGGKVNRTAAFLAICLVLAAAMTAAEERFGVPVYPGARSDEAVTRSIRAGMKIDAACYRTDDPVLTVAAFYRRQGLRLIGKVTAEAGFFQQGAVDVTLQRPWTDLATGTLMNDTLITIVRNPR